jgi:hypothetical protein
MPHNQSRHLGLTTVHVEHGLLRAHVIKAKLESVGIPVLLEYESIGPTIGITVDGIGEVWILVPSEYADEARGLIEEEDQALYPPPADDSGES